MTWPISTGIARGLSSSIAVHAVSGAALLDGSESDGTNVLTGTDAMTADWIPVAGALTNAAALAPNGATDASSFIENSSSGRHILAQIANGRTANSPLRLSIYAKMTGRRYLQLMWAPSNGTTGVIYAYFDLQAGAVTDSGILGGAQSVSNVSIAAAVNGYYKCTLQALASATSTDGYFIPALSDTGTYNAGAVVNNNPDYTGDGTSGAYFWRPKLVQL